MIDFQPKSNLETMKNINAKDKKKRKVESKMIDKLE